MLKKIALVTVGSLPSARLTGDPTSGEQAEGEKAAEQGADGIVWDSTLPDGGPTGGFFRDRNPIPW